MHKPRRRRDARRRHNRKKTSIDAASLPGVSMQGYRTRTDALPDQCAIDETTAQQWQPRSYGSEDDRAYSNPEQAIQAVRAGQAASQISLCPLSAAGRMSAETAQKTNQGVHLTDYQVWVRENEQHGEWAVCLSDGKRVTVKRCQSIQHALEWIEDAAPYAALRFEATSMEACTQVDAAVEAGYGLRLVKP